VRVAALVIGIDGWHSYTKPLIDSILFHEPLTQVITVDNASVAPYPLTGPGQIVRSNKRLCYSAAINLAAREAHEADWLIVLSNDVLCTGRFWRTLREAPEHSVLGPEVLTVRGRWRYVMGWCVAAPRHVWDEVGGWDENFIMSSWEDVDFSQSAIEKGFDLIEADLPFVHLDQRQRFKLPGFEGTPETNEAYFRSKHDLH
jgi:GT2 family glycosyltransferase